MSASAYLALPAEPGYSFRELIYAIGSETSYSATWILHKYYLYYPGIFRSSCPEGFFYKKSVLIKNLSNPQE